LCCLALLTPGSLRNRFVENGSLLQMINKLGVFPESLAAIYAAQMLKGLIYLHEKNVTHRWPFSLAPAFILAVDCLGLTLCHCSTIITITGTSRPPIF
jgi:hypothetical protein